MPKVIKIIKSLILMIMLLICGQVCLNKAETKTVNGNLNKTLDLHVMSVKLEEFKKNDLFNPLDTYNGDLTGYAADCPLCSGKLGCNGQNVLDRTTTFNDNDYGNVRIVASSRNLPCGSIVQFDLLNISNTPIVAIVLDRGVVGTALDLLVESQEFAISSVGRKQISYNVLRYGYER